MHSESTPARSARAAHLVRAVLVAGLLAACGGGARVSSVEPPSPTVPYAALIGTWTSTADPTTTLEFGADGVVDFRRGADGDGGCGFAGKATILRHDDQPGYLQVELSVDTCRAQLVYRMFDITARTDDQVTLQEDVAGEPAITFVRAGTP